MRQDALHHRAVHHREPGRALDLSSLAGIVFGLGLLVPVFLDPELGVLAIPAFVSLTAGLLGIAR